MMMASTIPAVAAAETAMAAASAFSFCSIRGAGDAGGDKRDAKFLAGVQLSAAGHCRGNQGDGSEKQGGGKVGFHGEFVKVRMLTGFLVT